MHSVARASARLGGGRRTTRKLARSEWSVRLRDLHPSYISWEDFEENPRHLYGNSKGIEIARSRAEHNGVAANVEALIMPANPTTSANDAFDVVHGLGILHHLGAEPGLAEVHRILKPGGIAVFFEPMGDCPWLEAAKKWLMTHARFFGFEEVTEHEENLRFQDIERAGARFSDMQIYPLHLLYRAKRFVPTSARDLLRKIDSGLLAVMPSLRHYAGAVVMRLRK